MTLSLDQLRAAIAAGEPSWHAEENDISRLPEADRRRRLGVRDRAAAAARVASVAADAAVAGAAPPPASFDWRDHGAVTAIRDQGSCGSCVSFACCAAVESAIRIDLRLTVDLSEADLFYCSPGTNCTDGWDPFDALDQLHARGICDEACFPYHAPAPPADKVTCAACAHRDRRAVTIAGQAAYFNAASFKHRIAVFGPLITCFDIYDDFYYYGSGVYKHTSGSYVGGHCVEVIGYDDAKHAWLCKNSWGESWGEQGFFQIGYGQCNIDEVMWEATTPVTVPAGFTYGMAYQAGGGHLSVAGSDDRGDQNLGMAAGTVPAMAALQGRGWQIAFQANTGTLWVVGKDHVGDTGQALKAGTSPSIAALDGGGWQAAYQAADGHLCTIGSAAAAKDMKLGMMAGTGPAIAAVEGGGWQVAFQANTGTLWVVGTQRVGDTKLAMKAGTSPSIAGLAGGGWAAAYQAANGHAWVVGSSAAAKDTGLGMMAGTSPSIAALDIGGWQLALHANSGHLWVIGADRRGDMGLNMAAGTSPALAALAGGGWEVAYQGPNGLSVTGTERDAGSLKLAMAAGSSPAIAPLPG